MHAIIVVLIFFMSVFIFIKRFKHCKNNYVYLNYHLFLLMFGLLYLGVGIIIKTVAENFIGIENIGFVNLAEHTEEANSLSVFFIFIFFMFYALDKTKSMNLTPESVIFNIYSSVVIRLFKMFVFSLFIIGVGLYTQYMLHFPYGNSRENLFIYSSDFISKFKIGYLFYFSMVSCSYISLATKKNRWFLCLIPFVLIELTAGGRIYFVQFIVFLFFSYSIISKSKINILTPLLAISLVLLLGVLRAWGTGFDSFFSLLVYTFGEFVNTSDAVLIALDRHEISYDFVNYMAYSFSRVLPSVFSDTFFALKFTPLVEIIDDLKSIYVGKDFQVGLGGSVLADAIFLTREHSYLIYLYPIAMGLWGGIVNRFFYRKGFVSFLLLCFSVSNLFVIFRYGFFTNFMYSISNVLFFGFFFIILAIFSWGQNERHKCSNSGI